MAKRSRRKKSLKVKVGYPHREHRSKKNRRSVPQYAKIQDYKRRKHKVKINEAQEKINANRN